MDELEPITCPNCGLEDEDGEIYWEEKVWVKRDVRGVRPETGAVVVDGTTERMQEEASADDGSERLFCCNCMHGWTPAGGYEH